MSGCRGVEGLGVARVQVRLDVGDRILERPLLNRAQNDHDDEGRTQDRHEPGQAGPEAPASAPIDQCVANDEDRDDEERGSDPVVGEEQGERQRRRGEAASMAIAEGRRQDQRQEQDQGDGDDDRSDEPTRVDRRGGPDAMM